MTKETKLVLDTMFERVIIERDNHNPKSARNIIEAIETYIHVCHKVIEFDPVYLEEQFNRFPLAWCTVAFIEFLRELGKDN